MSVNASSYSVEDYGAIGDGIHDDTMPIQLAIDGCQTDGGGWVLFPAGIYKVSSLQVPSNVILEGSGAFCTRLKTFQATEDVVSVNGYGVRLCNLGFDSFVERTGGSYVNFTPQASSCSIDHFAMEKAYIGVRGASPLSLYIEQGDIRNLSTAPGSCGVLINGGQDHYLSRLTMDNEPNAQPSAGIRIEATGNTNISDCDIIHCGYDLHIQGGYSIYVHDSYFDSAGCGIFIEALTGVHRCHFNGCWTAGHTGHGVLLNPGAIGTIDTIDFINHHSLGNSNDGIHLGKGNNLRVQASTCCTSPNGSGIGVGMGAKHVTILGNKLGSTGVMAGNAYGVFLINGCDYVLAANNDLLGNSVSSLVGGAPHQIVNNNFV